MGKESVHKAIGTSLRKFPVSGRNKAIMVLRMRMEVMTMRNTHSIR